MVLDPCAITSEEKAKIVRSRQALVRSDMRCQSFGIGSTAFIHSSRKKVPEIGDSTIRRRYLPERGLFHSVFLFFELVMFLAHSGGNGSVLKGNRKF